MAGWMDDRSERKLCPTEPIDAVARDRNEEKQCVMDESRLISINNVA